MATTNHAPHEMCKIEQVIFRFEVCLSIFPYDKHLHDVEDRQRQEGGIRHHNYSTDRQR
jgi:hypothetical protein